MFIFCLIGAITALGVIIYGSVELSNQLKTNYGEIKVGDKSLVLGGIVITTLLECYFLYNLWDYFVKKTFKVKLVPTNE